MNYICKFCNQERINPNSLRNHERLCNSNPNKQTTPFHDMEFQKTKNGKISNGYIKAKATGTIYVMSRESRAKISFANKNRSKEVLDKISKSLSLTINKKVAEGTWHTSLAKNMHYSYKGCDLHGTWELKYAMYLDKNNIKWERNKHRFNYVFENKERKYLPDFYLPETDEYIEIKGYKTSKDIEKWRCFPKDKKLTILFDKELKDLGILL